MNDKLKPALIGGVVLGILSAIPLVGAVNLCCCAWAIVGGVLAANLYIKSSPTPVKPADGAVVGAIAGAIGAAIYLVVGVPLGLLVGNTMSGALVNLAAQSDPAQAERLREQMAAQGAGIGGAIFMGLVWAVLLVIFSTVGGLIGVAIFEKRKGGPPPPPPPPAGGGFGGPAGGGFGGGPAGGGFGGPQGGGYGGPGAGGGYGQGT